MNLLLRCLLAVLRSCRRLVIANPKLRVLLYDLANRDEFGSLYEHEKMLADSVRVETYRRAIEMQIGPGDVVLDLGAGTGILSFLAAKQNPKQIYAIDHSSFIEIAKRIAGHNRIGNIEFVHTNSRSFNPGEKVDVILHEQIGDYLFNENMIQNLLDLKARLLKPGGRIIPGKFELFLEPACLEAAFHTPFIWEQCLDGIDFGFLQELAADLEAFRPAGYRQEWLEAAAVKYFLCKPSPVLTFDLNQLRAEKDLPRSIRISRQVTKPGSLDRFCLYFKVIFTEDIHFDTSPCSRNTHWGNCFFRVASRSYAAGESIGYELVMQDLLDIKTWSVTIQE
jgi:protein arginine N-methyltransferase 1